MGQRTQPPDLPGFTYIGWIGGGGFADVFRYRDSLGRGVAVKVLHQTVDETAFNAFAAEAVLMARLSGHPNIVTIHSSGLSPDGRPFLVMEECSSTHLGSRISNRVLPPTQAIEFTIQLAGAVETAHQQGILHRDIKPANILFTGFQRPALTDFGISASQDQRALANALSPLWAPIEQHPNAGMEPGPWSDVFSLAATTWAMLVGRSPLAVPGADNGTAALRERARNFHCPRTGRSDVPQTLENVLATAMAGNPARRYSSAQEFARALQSVQTRHGLPMTPFDVLAASVDQEPRRLDQGFDPSWPNADSSQMLTGSYTSGLSSYTGGYLSYQDPASLVDDPTPPSVSTGAPEPGVLLRGSGFAQAGPRDVGTLPVPEAQPSPTPEPEPTPRNGRRTLLAVLGGLLLVAGITLALLFANGTFGGGSTKAVPTGEATKVPAVVDVTSSVTGEQVKFTWTNPAPQAEDVYLIEIIGAPSSESRVRVSEPEVIVPVQEGETCVNITVRRRVQGQVSEPVRACATK